MTLKNNKAPLLSNIKLCASFHHHMRIQTGGTVRKRLKWVFNFWHLWPWPLTLIFCMNITSVIVNNYWKFHDDIMRGTLWKRCNRSRQTSVLHIWYEHQVKLDAPHSAPTYLCRFVVHTEIFEWNLMTFPWPFKDLFKQQGRNYPGKK